MENTIGNQQAINSQASSKLLAVVRHGERFDECALDDELKYGSEEYYDTHLTDVGRLNSWSTGYKLAELIWNHQRHAGGYPRVKFVSSLFYRCLQTCQSLRDGMKQYIEEHQTEFDNPEAALKMVLSEPTYVEEACSEKIYLLPEEGIENMRIIKSRENILKQFSNINPVVSGLFDYSGDHMNLSLRTRHNSKDDLQIACNTFIKHTVSSLVDDPGYDVYVVITHAMYISAALLTSRIMASSSIKYNACLLLGIEANPDKDKPDVKAIVKSKPIF